MGKLKNMTAPMSAAVFPNGQISFKLIIIFNYIKIAEIQHWLDERNGSRRGGRCSKFSWNKSPWTFSIIQRLQRLINPRLVTLWTVYLITQIQYVRKFGKNFGLFNKVPDKLSYFF